MKYPLYPHSVAKDKFASFLQTRGKLQEFGGKDLYKRNLHFLYHYLGCFTVCDFKPNAVYLHVRVCCNCHLISFYKWKTADSCMNLG